MTGKDLLEKLWEIHRGLWFSPQWRLERERYELVNEAINALREGNAAKGREIAKVLGVNDC
jgi:hypothetical protein